MAEILAFKTNEQLAEDAINGLGLDCGGHYADKAEPPTWMDERGITREDIAAAFARLRASFHSRVQETL